MKITFAQNGEFVAEIDLAQGQYTVGRSDDCAVVVDDPSIAECHARLLEDAGIVYIEPAGGETTVNGAAVTERTALKDGDQVNFGDLELSISIPAEPVAEADDVLAPEEDVHEKASAGIGRGLLGMAKASAREAGRGARLAGLKAQIEKQRRVNLHAAHLSLGRKAYESEVMPEAFADEYSQLRDLDARIAEKRKGVAAADGAGVMAKAKAKAVTAKMRAEAELLEHKRNGVLVQLGQRIAKEAPDQAELAGELQAIEEVSQRIEELRVQYNSTSSDHSARDDLTSSAKLMGATRSPKEAFVTDNGKPASKRRSWLAKVGLCGGGVLVILVIIGGLTEESSAPPRSTVGGNNRERQKTATLRAWRDFQAVDYQLGQTQFATYSALLTQQSYLYSTIDLGDVDPLLQRHLQECISTCRSAVALCIEIETQVTALRQNTEAAGGWGALLGAAASDGYNPQGDAAAGAILFGLLGAAAQQPEYARIQQQYGAQWQQMQEQLRACNDADKKVASLLTQKYGIPFTDPF